MNLKILSTILAFSIFSSLNFCVMADESIINESVGYWTFDDASPADMQSEVNADIWGTPAKVGNRIGGEQSGMVGGAFRFNKNMDQSPARYGTENYINLGGVPDLIKDTQQLTVSMWVKPMGYAWWQSLFSFSDPTVNESLFSIYFENGNLMAIVNNDSLSVNKPWAVNEWHLMTVTIDYNGKFNFAAYFDDTKIGGRNIGNYNVDLSSCEMWLGGRNIGGLFQDDFNGLLDDVRIYNRVLTDDEVSELYGSYSVNAVLDKDYIKMYSCNKISADNYVDITVKNDSYVDNIDASMFIASDLPEGLSISNVELIDSDTARVYISGTSLQDIQQDRQFSINVSSSATKLACKDGNAVTCTIRKPDNFVIEAEASQNGGTLIVSGKVVNSFNTVQSAVVVIGVYDGDMMKTAIPIEIKDLAKDGETEIDKSFDISGYSDAKVNVLVLDKLPGKDENGAFGGKLLAESYKYNDEYEVNTSENTDVTVDVDGDAKSVTVSGALEGQMAVIAVYKEIGSDLVIDYIKEVKVGEDGKINHKYTMNSFSDGVVYDVYIADDAKTLLKQFKFYSSDYRNEILRTAKGMSGSELEEYLKENRFVLDIDLTDSGAYGMLSESAKASFWTELEKVMKDCSTQKQFKTVFVNLGTEMTVIDKINNAVSAEEIISIIDSSNQILGFHLNDDYEQYKARIAEKILSKDYRNLEEAQAAYENIFYTTVFNAIDYTDRVTMLEMLEKYKSELDIDPKFFGDKENTYVKHIMGITFADKADITEKAKQAIIKGDQSKSSASGGGSSGKATSSSVRMVPVIDNSAVQEPIISAKEANAVFVDLDSVPWAKEAIELLAEKNVISGKAERTFVPNDYVTRAEFAKMIVMSFGSYNENITTDSFSDVAAEAWYTPYIANAEERKLINGKDDGTFGVNENITREDICVILYRQLAASGKTFESDETPFVDADNISEYAFEAVGALKGAGIVNGVDDGRFAPKENCTRAMAAKVIYEAMNFE